MSKLSIKYKPPPQRCREGFLDYGIPESEIDGIAKEITTAMIAESRRQLNPEMSSILDDYAKTNYGVPEAVIEFYEWLQKGYDITKKSDDRNG